DKPVRARKGIYSCILIGIVVSVCASVLLIQMSDVVFSLFTKDESVIEIGYEIIKVTFPYYFIYVFLEVFSNTLRGAGHSIQPMLIILLNMCGVRVVMVYLMMHVAQTAQGIAVVYPVTWLTASVSMIIYFKISNCLEKNSKKK
ncbi:MAG: MATE family efflux transporter, partial [Lachnospiraceae bacterium]|nr:MATE family efflux transporter [Lachnospiraceae bacterium]